ncbi:hypothetical protein NC990_14345 [Funiculus sociatus GB2-M1]
MSALVLSTGIKFGQSPPDLILRGIFQIDRGIQVSLNLDATPLAIKHTLSQRHGLKVSTVRTSLATGIQPINQFNLCTLR